MTNIELNNIKKIYFIGIGGIGMSAIARYFLGRGCAVHGYDKTETELTKTLASEGMKVHYVDDVTFIPEGVDLVVYTPAVPKNHSELLWFQEKNFPILKRAAVLGIISRGMKCIAVAGTHGKTTTSSIVTHILRVGGIDATAFLGGISLSLGSNFVEGKSDWVVVEADEYDRSFLQLDPNIAIINSLDPDHLDIYGDEKEFRRNFSLFAKRIKERGILLLKSGLKLPAIRSRKGIENPEWDKILARKTAEKYSFAIGKGDYKAIKIRVENGFFVFDFKSPLGEIKDIKTTLPGNHNIENAVAAIAVAQQLKIKPEKIKEALANFKGIRRRFEFIVRPDDANSTVFIDDYAHHPTELESAIAATKALYPTRKSTGIFQPHLFTRTRDFQDGFAAALDKLDEVFLMDIYPARELPIEGVTSEILFNKMHNPNKTLVTKQNLMEILRGGNYDVLLTLGAGDIDTFVQPIKNMLENQK
jgi:UDP-N-acetylmuramate--alanine ligase